jgi:hypothetical protein
VLTLTIYVSVVSSVPLHAFLVTVDDKQQQGPDAMGLRFFRMDIFGEFSILSDA